MCGALHRRADQVRLGPSPKASIFRLNIFWILNVCIIDTTPALSALFHIYTCIHETQYMARCIHHTIYWIHCIINELLYTHKQDKPETQFANQRSTSYSHELAPYICTPLTLLFSHHRKTARLATLHTPAKKNCRFRWTTRLYAHNTRSKQKTSLRSVFALFFRSKLGPFNFFSINNSMA